MVYTADRHKKWQDNVMKIYNMWCTTVTSIQNKKDMRKIYICSQTYLFLKSTMMFFVTSKIHPRNKSYIMKKKVKERYPVWFKSKQRKHESQLLRDAGQSTYLYTHMPTFQWRYTQHGQFSSLGWLLDSVHSLRRWVIYVKLWRLLCFFFCSFFIKFFLLIWHTQLTSRSALGGKGGDSFLATFPVSLPAWRSWAALPACTPSRGAGCPGGKKTKNTQIHGKRFISESLNVAEGLNETMSCKL